MLPSTVEKVLNQVVPGFLPAVSFTVELSYVINGGNDKYQHTQMVGLRIIYLFSCGNSTELAILTSVIASCES